MHTLFRNVNFILATFCIGILGVMVICVVWQVTSRYVLGTPSVVTDELSRLLFMCLGLIGGAYTAGQRRHLAIDLLPAYLSASSRRILGFIVEFFVLAFAAIILVAGGGWLAFDTLKSGQASPVMGCPMGIVYLSIPISGILIIFYSIITIIEGIRGISFRDIDAKHIPGDA